ncbi:putative EngB-type G domain-containing protein [Seiridium unicorne]|uniref:EngB-type G domain-containing protein n=1 Tax=Seiridium unicorne TaxID=138068 RepID=A0ABR2UXI8_9PEZI
MTTRQINGLLAMPPSLRPLLLTTHGAPSPGLQVRCFHETCRAYARYLKRPLTVGAFTVPHSPTFPLSEVSIKELLESPKPDKSLADELNVLFTRNPATFYHGTSDFYELKKNTRIPEICILGRSNVGKSTFVNALANRQANELAHTSARAGRTKAMNAFGFGPAPTMKELADTDTETKRTEDLPKHTFFVLDMPGYGHKSLQDWGKHITLYLNKRQAIKGAILLIDGEVGPKSGDLIALELLQAAGLKTAIVLTKADKVKHEDMLKETCREMWTTMRNIHDRDPNSKWEWERDFFVTALGATKKEIGIETVAIARLAVARLAGLVVEKERPETEPAKGYSGNIVSFDNLEYAPSKSPEKVPVLETSSFGFTALEQAAREQHAARTAIGRVTSETPVRQAPRTASKPVMPSIKSTRVGRLSSRTSSRRVGRPVVRSTLSASKQPSSTPSTLEQAESKQHKPNSTTSRLPSTSSSRWASASNPRRFHGRSIHTSHRPLSQIRSLNTLSGQDALTSEELEKTLKEFSANLKVNSTPLDNAKRLRLESHRDRPQYKIWDPTFIGPKRDDTNRRKKREERHMMILKMRLLRDQMNEQRREERQKWREEEEGRAGITGKQKLRDELRADIDGENKDEEAQVQSWDQIQEAQEVRERVLSGKKAKRAKRDEEKAARRKEKQRKQRKETMDGDDDFAAKFEAVR